MESENDKITLSPADAAAVDAVLNGEGEADGVRRQIVEQWLKVLAVAPGGARGGGGVDLVEGTLAAVAADTMRIAPEVPPKTFKRPSQWKRRLAEIGAMAVAAMLLLAVTVEGLGQMNRSKARMACSANLQKMGVAFGNYSSSIGNGALPMIAVPSNQNWLYGNVSTGAKNNAANLLPLVTGQYVPIAAFFCAGAGLPKGPVEVATNQMPAIGYSYRLMLGPNRATWDRLATTIVMTDKNPVFAADAVGRTGMDQKNSENHDGRGTYILRADGSVPWEVSPNVGPDHDNIWTIGSGKERLAVYAGTELPASAKDVFVCP